jgi:hypothetical protein
MKKWLGLILLCGFASAAFAADVRQPVFLICPAEHGYSAWSVDLTCDAANPGKISTISIDKLKRKNAKDATFGDVVKAQSDPATEREQIATLSAKDFASGSLAVKKDEALTITLKATADGDYQMAINLRVGAEEHFFIGGKEEKKRDVVLHFDKAKKKWGAYAVALEDTVGKNAISGGQKPMLGLVFPVNQASGISKLIAVINTDDAVVLYEKPDTSPKP